ncbi:MAG: DUF2066 domain-containing protein [Gammaproteobacteria bacterium]|nr:MAG: DUF2066 domain-containing protein [Gammaproteobacteria bacterium]
MAISPAHQRISNKRYRRCGRSGLLCVSLFVFSGFVAAAEVKNIYEHEVDVESQAIEFRAGAMRRTLAGVLVKVTGDSRVASSPAVQGILNYAQQWAVQFGYRLREHETAPEGQMRFWARFNKQAVNTAIRDAGLPVWPPERPLILVWMGIEDGGEQVMMAEDTIHPVRESLDEAAGIRGIPLGFPVLDLNERSQIGFDDIALARMEQLKGVSGRYGAQALLVGYLTRRGAQDWWLRLVLDQQGVRQSWNVSGPSLDEVIKAGINRVADHLARQYANFASLSGEQSLDVMVTGIMDLDGYARTLKYLQSLSVVSGVQVIRVEPDRVLYRLSTPTNAAAFMQLVSIGRVLESMGDVQELVFRLFP